MARRGTEAFPDLGAQCDREDCNQLDFLPFDCDGCGKTFCAEHRTYRDHGCARAADQGRTVVVCEACGDAIERRAGDGGGDDAAVLEAHARSAGQCGRDAQKKEGGGWKLPQSVRNMKIF
uniref:AN1-type domain-containing protein n=1 Tax=Oryza glumipatula TaxID=40148 RepID=A0A0E0B2G5_9ORYZ